MSKTTTTPTTPDFKGLLSNLEKTLNEYLVVKAPSLPENVKAAIVKYAPYISLIMVVLFLPAILLALGLSALLSPFAFLGGISYGASFTIGTLFLIASLVVEVMAIPGLFKQQASAWKLMFYGVLLSAVYSLLSFRIDQLIINSLISLYILFQVKSYYKN